MLAIFWPDIQRYGLCPAANALLKGLGLQHFDAPGLLIIEVICVGG